MSCSIHAALTFSHTFLANVEGQASVVKGDSLLLLDDANSYWWLVRVLKTEDVGYIPAENVETPYERLARLNKHRNIDIAAPTELEKSTNPSQPRESKLKTLIGWTRRTSRGSLDSEEIENREGRRVIFAPPTYVDHPGVTWSSDEEDDDMEEDEQHFADDEDQELGYEAEPDDGVEWAQDAVEAIRSATDAPQTAANAGDTVSRTTVVAVAGAGVASTAIGAGIASTIVTSTSTPSSASDAETITVDSTRSAAAVAATAPSIVSGTDSTPAQNPQDAQAQPAPVHQAGEPTGQGPPAPTNQGDVVSETPASPTAPGAPAAVASTVTGLSTNAHPAFPPAPERSPSPARPTSLLARTNPTPPPHRAGALSVSPEFDSPALTARDMAAVTPPPPSASTSEHPSTPQFTSAGSTETPMTSLSLTRNSPHTTPSTSPTDGRAGSSAQPRAPMWYLSASDVSRLATLVRIRAENEGVQARLTHLEESDEVQHSLYGEKVDTSFLHPDVRSGYVHLQAKLDAFDREIDAILGSLAVPAC